VHNCRKVEGEKDCKKYGIATNMNIRRRDAQRKECQVWEAQKLTIHTCKAEDLGIEQDTRSAKTRRQGKGGGGGTRGDTFSRNQPEKKRMHQTELAPKVLISVGWKGEQAQKQSPEKNTF